MNANTSNITKTITSCGLRQVSMDMMIPPLEYNNKHAQRDSKQAATQRNTHQASTIHELIPNNNDIHIT